MRATATPSGAISKMPNGGSLRSRTTQSTSRFVEVPMREEVPPRSTM